MSNQSQGAQKRILITLAICVAAILLATIMGSYIQTAGWRYTVEDLRDATNKGTISLVATDDGATEAKDYTVSGKVTSGLLFRPKKAEDGSRPAVVLSHGWYNNREMQLQNAIELVRRGYVVLCIDQPGHGHNEEGAGTSTLMGFYGATMYDCAKYLYNLPEVNKDKIAVSGHSMGGAATTNTLSSDAQSAGKLKDANFSAGKNLGIISAALVQANEAPSSVAPNVIAVGLVKGNADEFFFSSQIREATYVLQASGVVTEDNFDDVDANGDPLFYVKKGKNYVGATKYVKNGKYYKFTTSVPTTYYMESQKAFTFTRGRKATVDGDLDWTTVNGGIYSNGELIAQPNKHRLVSVANKGAQLASETQQIRAVYQANETHPMNHWSTKTAAHVIDFFYNAFGVTEGWSYKAPTNQTWWLKEAFAAIGILGLFGMLLPILDLLLQSKLFASLKGEVSEAPVLLTRPRKHVSYWLGGIITTIFGAVSFHNLVAEGKWFNKMEWLYAKLTDASKGFIYENVAKIAAWGIMCAIFALIVTGIIWLVNHIINVCKYGDEAPAYDEHPFAGFQIRSFGNVIKTLVVAAILVGVFFTVVFYIWKETCVMFQVWTFGFRVFDEIRIASMLQYVPYFFVYYLVNAALAQGYRVKDLPEWATIAINVVFNVIGFTLIVWHANNYFIHQGAMGHASNNMNYIHAVPLIPAISIATVLARRIYTRTGNAWLAGLVNATIMTIMACANTSIAAAPAWQYHNLFPAA